MTTRRPAGDPEMSVPDTECEEMCYFFAHLCHDQFGEFPDTGSGISRESRSNLVACDPRTGSVADVRTEAPTDKYLLWPPDPTQGSGRDSRLGPASLPVLRRLRTRTLQEPRIERREHQDDSDVCYQPQPEVVPEASTETSGLSEVSVETSGLP